MFYYYILCYCSFFINLLYWIFLFAVRYFRMELLGWSCGLNSKLYLLSSSCLRFNFLELYYFYWFLCFDSIYKFTLLLFYFLQIFLFSFLYWVYVLEHIFNKYCCLIFGTFFAFVFVFLTPIFFGFF